MLTNMLNSTSMMKFLGLKRAANNITISLEGRCVFIECEIKVLEEKEITEELQPGKKSAKIIKQPTLIELVPVNKEMSLKNLSTRDLRRTLVELSGEAYSLGEVLPFQRIVEPTVETSLSPIKIKISPGADISKLDLKKALRLYMLE
jgi:hypothetical protein